ncbi:hypothetical protein K440DRAFT_664447 [Wilcoxina mikolae CBS 423.85]|nr:hypothetical protein K440DRAFT_664447 [Wilcoxina mikolae CBS 423.85]
MARNTKSRDRLAPRTLPSAAISSPSSASDDDSPVTSDLPPSSPVVSAISATEFYSSTRPTRQKTYGKRTTINPRNLHRFSTDDTKSPHFGRVQAHRVKREEPKLIGLKPADFGINTTTPKIKLQEQPWFTEDSDEDTLSPAKREPKKVVQKQLELKWPTRKPEKVMECRTLCDPIECPFCWEPFVRVEKLWETDAFVEHMRIVHKNIDTEENQIYRETWDAIALLDYDREFHEQLLEIERMEVRERAKKEWIKATGGKSVKKPADIAALIVQIADEECMSDVSEDFAWDVEKVMNIEMLDGIGDNTEEKKESEDICRADTWGDNILKRVSGDPENPSGKRLCEGLEC